MFELHLYLAMFLSFQESVPYVLLLLFTGAMFAFAFALLGIIAAS